MSNGGCISNEVANSTWEEVESRSNRYRSPAIRLCSQKSTRSSAQTHFLTLIGVTQFSNGRRLHFLFGKSIQKAAKMHYCGCYSFFYDVVNRGEQLCCKHQLAARLASSLGSCAVVNVPDDQLALLLSNH
ncbi:hypothetical protein MLD38_023306 [Melastoma candidum]|uniref:Uncharacterized protein n=1 Tax=Melastoma candidum TaxID=119954 RepID=A0ACB9QNA0_9MYRT|nr:hypothetical protein MLD38_023306 [Melastoma candidum]